MKGTVDLLGDGTISAFQLSMLRLSPGDNMQAEGQKTPTGMRIAMKGNSFDARPFLRGAKANAGAASAKEIEIDLKAVALSGFNGEIASNGEIKLLRKGAQLFKGTISGRLNGELLSGKISPRSDGTSLMSLQSENAGALLRFLDIYNRMQGGRFDALITLAGQREKGWFTVRDFDLRTSRRCRGSRPRPPSLPTGREAARAAPLWSRTPAMWPSSR